MSEKRVKVEREVSEREIKVERENVVSVYATGVFPSGTLDITENGEYDVTATKTVNVDILSRDDAFTADPVADLSSALTYGKVNLSESITQFTNKNFTNLVELKATGGGAIVNMGQCFHGCDNLETIDFTELIISDTRGVYLSQFAYGRTKLKTVKFRSGTKVNHCQNAFDGCTGLEEVDFSNVDTSLATNFSFCFQRCTALKTINLSGWVNPNTVNTSSMFNNCAALEALIIDGESVFNLSNASGLETSGIGLGTGYVYVPDALVESYKAAQYWSSYANNIKPLSELPEEYRS